MSLRATAVLIVCAVFTGLFVLLYLFSSHTIRSSFDNLERETAYKNLDRAQNALDGELSSLDALVVDWAMWDDTYQYVADGDEAFIEANLTPQSLGDLNLDLVVVLDDQGHPLVGVTYDRRAKTVQPLPGKILAAIAAESKLTRRHDESSLKRDIMLLPLGPLLVVARPVLRSDKSGPPRGALIMGRLLDAERMAVLSEKTRLNLFVEKLSVVRTSSRLKDVLAELQRTQLPQIMPESESLMAGYALLRDLNGEPALILRMLMTRDIHAQGLATLRINFLALLVIGTAFGLAMLTLVESRVVSRVRSLGLRIRDIRQGRVSPRLVEVRGRDEIAGLARDLNDMLGEIDRAGRELAVSEERYELATRAARVGVWDFDASTGEFYIDQTLAGHIGHKAVAELRRGVAEWAGSRAGQADGRDILLEFRGQGGRRIMARGRGAPDGPGGFKRVVGTASDVTELKKAEESIRSLSRALITAQEKERARIARDLHDNVAQDLSSLKIALETLFDGLPPAGPPLDARLADLGRGLTRAVASVRELSYGLRPPDLDILGLSRAVARLCQEYSAKAGFKVDFSSAGLPEAGLDPDLEINIYRIVREALHNARVHAGAENVAVRLVDSPPRVIVRIEDDGRGFDPSDRLAEALAEKRMGLRGMRERVELFGGVLRIWSEPGRGARIVAEIPYDRDKDEEA